MPSIEVIRAANRPIADQIDEMRRWLDREGIRASDLHAVRILGGRVTFNATFKHAGDADRFIRKFGDTD
jgi:hypothetical protein